MASPALVWFRNDLRLTDNPALAAACDSGRPVSLLYILDDLTAGDWAMGGAQRWWLYHSLTSLARSIEAIGGRLTLRRGDAAQILPMVVEDTGAEAVFWNRLYDAPSRKRDETLKANLKAKGLTVESFNALLMREPWEVLTPKGTPYGVYSPMWKQFWSLGDPSIPLGAPDGIEPGPEIASDNLADWTLQPTKPDWSGGLRAAWTPGEQGARERFDAFLGDNGLPAYKEDRNRPDLPATSRMSPHLRFGEVSPRQLWHRARAHDGGNQPDAGTLHYLKELAWREFSYQLLFNNPDLPEEPLRPEFKNFPWHSDEAGLDAWQQGKTGYPIVDAGMRELYQTGWMHNRVRMITASFLIKDLMLPWQLGERWFWDTLVDADIASNSASWQWVAGCGADAAPFFRVFNPVLQGEKFDPNGDYVRKWIPEIATLPNKFIHKPWQAPEEILEKSEVALGNDYPKPILDHHMARERALEAFQQIKKGAA